jgi:uncharacterized GH25 family protein
MNERRGFALMLAALIGLCSASTVAAHDFWVQPAQYWTMPQSVTSITLQVGHGPSRQRSPIPRQRIARFEAITPAGEVVDLRGSLDLGGDSSDGAFRLRAPGAYVLVLETDETQGRMPAARFNGYLREEGLSLALEQRERTQRIDADGRERYSRRAKSIVQVGSQDQGSQSQITRPLGLELEIVPEANPYAEPRAAILPVRVFFEGAPLAGALVKLTNLEHDAEPTDVQRTNDVGRVAFRMPESGTWLVNVVWTRPLTDAPDAEFETVFSSLSFGFQ